jgi:hypothetical protein
MLYYDSLAQFEKRGIKHEYIVRLIGQVVTLSVKTLEIISDCFHRSPLKNNHDSIQFGNESLATPVAKRSAAQEKSKSATRRNL